MPKTNLHYLNVVKPFDAIKIKYKDVLDFGEFYAAMYEWMKEHGWRDPEEGEDHFETYYGEKISQNGSKEIWIRWRLTKTPQDVGEINVGQVNDGIPALRYHLDIDYHLLGLSGVEIVKEGKKIKAQKGEVEITIKPLMEKLYSSVFDKHEILKHFKPFFERKVYKSVVDTRVKQLYQEMYELQNWMKQWLKLKRYLPYEETKGFHPSLAYPSFGKDE